MDYVANHAILVCFFLVGTGHCHGGLINYYYMIVIFLVEWLGSSFILFYSSMFIIFYIMTCFKANLHFIIQ